MPVARRACASTPPGRLAVAAAAGLACAAPSPSTPAEALLDRSIAFHDPGALWGTRPYELRWVGTDADGAERVDVAFVLYPDQTRFELEGRYRGSALEYRTSGDTWSGSVDGSSDPSPEQREAMRLERENGLFWRSYFGFLAGLPMKLRDPGTHIDPETIPTTFVGKEALAIRVTYDPAVGADTWYFYFDPSTAALLGCRFFHDEAANDGEYLVFEGLIEADRLRLPRQRSWYVNADDRLLGTDEIRSLSVSAGLPGR